MSDLMQSETKTKWWKKPENWFTYGGLAAIGLVIFKGLDVILPLLLRVFTNLAYLGGFVAVGLLLISNRQLLWYMYKVLMKKITKIFVEIDPIAIMETYAGTLKEKYEEILKSLGELKAQRRNLEKVINDSEKEYTNCMQLAKKAEQIGGDEMLIQMNLESRNAARLAESIEKYRKDLVQMNGWIAINEKLKNASHFAIVDIENTVKQKKKDLEIMTSNYKAMNGFKKILQSGKDRELFDMAVESQNNQYFQMLGEIEQFMEDSKSIVNNFDLQNGVYLDTGLAKLKEWENRPLALYGKNAETPLLNASNSVTTTSASSNPFEQLLNK